MLDFLKSGSLLSVSFYLGVLAPLLGLRYYSNTNESLLLLRSAQMPHHWTPLIFGCFKRFWAHSLPWWALRHVLPPNGLSDFSIIFTTMQPRKSQISLDKYPLEPGQLSIRLPPPCHGFYLIGSVSFLHSFLCGQFPSSNLALSYLYS